MLMSAHPWRVRGVPSTPTNELPIHGRRDCSAVFACCHTSCQRRLTAAPVSSRNVAGVLNTVPWIVNAVGVLCRKRLYVLTAM